MSEKYKNLIWIDDDIEKLKQLVDTVFRRLWAKGIKNYVCILGNDYKSYTDMDDYSKEDIQYFISRMVDSYGAFCNTIKLNDAQGPKTAMEYFKNTSKEYVGEKFVKYLGSGENVLGSNTDDMFFQLLNQNGFEITPENFAFALDLRLFKHDYEKVIENKKIESMKLASAFQKKKYSYYLYTFFRYDNQFVLSWKKTIKKLYEVDSEVWPSIKLVKCDEKAQAFEQLIDVCTISKGEEDENGVTK